MRFVSKHDEQNLGFTNDEINILVERLNISNKIFISYLKHAGKKSNVFGFNFDNVDSYIKFQDDFRILIESDSAINLNANAYCCFYITQDGINNECFYFVPIDNETTDPEVYCYSSGEVPLTGNLRDDRTEKIGLQKLENNFTTYVNDKTDFKFGRVWWKEMIGYVILFLLFPLWLPFLIYYKIKEKS